MSTRWLNLTGLTGDRVTLRAAAISAVMTAPGEDRGQDADPDRTIVYVAGSELPFAVVEPLTAVVAMADIAADDAAREARGQGPLNGPGRR